MEASAAATSRPRDRASELARSEFALGLEIARRTKPALPALHATLADEQKKTFGALAAQRRQMGMGMR